MMKKVITALLLAAMMLSLFVGCGAQSAAPAPEITAAPAETAAAPETVPETTAAPAESVTVRLGAMTGPTGIGMAKIFRDADNGEGDYTYTIAGSADELTPLILQGQLDIVSVPSNLASVLYNKTEGGVQALAVNVLGVLYVVEFGSEEIRTVADLKGKTIYATGKGSVPEYFLRYVLQENGIDPDNDVTIDFKAEPAEVIAALNASGQGIAMLPQPQVTVAGAKLGEGYRVALSLTEAWADLNNGTMCTTAVIMARTEFAQAHPEAVEAFLEDFAQSALWVNTETAEAAALVAEKEIIGAPAAVLEKAIPKCNVVCITGPEMKDALSGCLSVLFEQNPKAVGGKLPGDDFYYGA